MAFAPGAVLSLRLIAPGVVEGVVNEARRFFASRLARPLAFVSQRVGPMIAGALLLFLAVAVLAGRFRRRPDRHRLRPAAAAAPRNLSWKRGLERLRPSRVAWDLVRSAAKMALLVAFTWSSLETWIAFLRSRHSLSVALTTTTDQAWGLIARTALAAVAVAIADYAINRYRTQKSLKMTRSEVKRDLKDSEGDPVLKMRRRRLASEISRNRMISDVAGLTWWSPTRRTSPSPSATTPTSRLRGGGAVRALAERIKAEARRHGVFVTENKPLARALYRSCKVGQFIPSSLYEAVAVVLATAFRRRGWAA